jgi:hypothetical protein
MASNGKVKQELVDDSEKHFSESSTNGYLTIGHPAGGWNSLAMPRRYVDQAEVANEGMA